MYTSKVLLFSVVFFITGCGAGTYLGSEGEPIPQEYSIDAVKAINPNISRYDEVSMYSQPTYSISNDTRLLLRFESLKSHSGNILTTDKDYLELQVGIVTDERFIPPKKEEKKKTDDKDDTKKDPEPEPEVPPTLKAAMTNLKLCPLVRTFMMLSTWYVIHPFGQEGKWTNPGGDFDAASCVRATKVNQNYVLFDLKTWFIDYARGRGVNHGFILMSDRPVNIFGDQSGSHSPRVRWTEPASSIRSYR